MSYQHPMILFVGRGERGNQLLDAVEPMGWWVYQPQTTNEALGMYVSYLPDVVLLDAEAAPEIVEEVYYHLAPMATEPIIVIADHDSWSDRVTYHLPAQADLMDIIDCITKITNADWQPETSQY